MSPNDQQEDQMTFMKQAAIAAFALLVSASSAFAAQAVVTTQLNVRAGPGPGFHVIDVLYRGEVVDVDRCKGSWCYVIKDGPNGWVSARYLDANYGDDDDFFNDNVVIVHKRPRIVIQQSFPFPEPDPYPAVTDYPTLDPGMGNGQVCYQTSDGATVCHD
jgi:uncharacterized protein YraI